MDESGRLFDEFNNAISTKVGSGMRQNDKYKPKPKGGDSTDLKKMDLKTVNDKRSVFYDPTIERAKNVGRLTQKREKKEAASFIFKEKGSQQKAEMKVRKKEAISALEDQQALLTKSITSVLSETSALDKIALKPPVRRRVLDRIQYQIWSGGMPLWWS